MASFPLGEGGAKRRMRVDRFFNVDNPTVISHLDFSLRKNGRLLWRPLGNLLDNALRDFLPEQGRTRG